MKIDEYYIEQKKYTKNPKRKKIDRITYLALGIAEEAGEIVGEVKKAWRNKNGNFTPQRLENITIEMGDLFNLQIRLMKELGIKLPDVLDKHIDKLKDRNNAF